MRLDDLGNDVQAQTQALAAARLMQTRPERIEQMRQYIRCDRAAVSYHQ